MSGRHEYATRVEQDGLRWKTAGSARPENAWKGGPRKKLCRVCDAEFTTGQKDVRCCPKCRGEDPVGRPRGPQPVVAP